VPEPPNRQIPFAYRIQDLYKGGKRGDIDPTVRTDQEEEQEETKLANNNFNRNKTLQTASWSSIRTFTNVLRLSESLRSM
jgi:hypothetical protein